jgi:hypothetical protein
VGLPVNIAATSQQLAAQDEASIIGRVHAAQSSSQLRVLYDEARECIPDPTRALQAVGLTLKIIDEATRNNATPSPSVSNDRAGANHSRMTEAQMQMQCHQDILAHEQRGRLLEQQRQWLVSQRAADADGTACWAAQDQRIGRAPSQTGVASRSQGSPALTQTFDSRRQGASRHRAICDRRVTDSLETHQLIPGSVSEPNEPVAALLVC